MSSKIEIRIEAVQFHRNGSAGNSFHVVRFRFGRGQTLKRMIAVVFAERRSVAVLREDGVAGGDAVTIGDKWDGPEFEDAVRLGVLVFEQDRAGASLCAAEIRDLSFGRHVYVPMGRNSNVCGICKGRH